MFSSSDMSLSEGSLGTIYIFRQQFKSTQHLVWKAQTVGSTFGAIHYSSVGPEHGEALYQCYCAMILIWQIPLTTPAKLNRLYFLRWLCAFMGSTVLGCSFRTVVSSVMPYTTDEFPLFCNQDTAVYLARHGGFRVITFDALQHLETIVFLAANLSCHRLDMQEMLVVHDAGYVKCL